MVAFRHFRDAFSVVFGLSLTQDPEEDPEEDDEDPKEDPADYLPMDDIDGEEEMSHSTPFWSDTEIPSPLLSPILSPLLVSPPLHISSPPPASPIRLLGYRAAMIRLRAEAPSTSYSLPLPLPIILSYTRSDAPSSGTPPLLPILLPTSSLPLHLLSSDRRADRPEVTLLPRKRVDNGFVCLPMERRLITDLERDVSYGITDTWDEMLTERQLMAGRLNMLYRDRHAHARTARLMEAEARMAREA
ncbi:hypothetical protein Tco_0581505 [Tanacetum coccineum]